jgi:hypothetical protein
MMVLKVSDASALESTTCVAAEVEVALVAEEPVEVERSIDIEGVELISAIGIEV